MKTKWEIKAIKMDTFLCNRPMQCNTKNRDHSSFVVATVNPEVNHL